MLCIEKATKLGDMLRAFRLEPLNDSMFSKFYYNNTMPIRTGDECSSPLEDLFDECTTPLSKNAHLLMGHGGCGKSTELFRLKQRFDQSGHPTCIIDFMAETDSQRANRWDIMLLITEGLCKVIDERKLSVKKDILTAILNYLKRDEVKTNDAIILREIGAAGGVEAKTPAILKGLLNVFASIKFDLKANASTRTLITEKMEKRASEWISYIKEISDNVIIGLNGLQPILVFENLDKMQPPDKALEILRYPYLSEMPFPIIYTFPISLYYDPSFAFVKNNYIAHTLPMIKVSNEDKSDNVGGIGVIREIVKLRADINLFDDDALDLLIKQTGGVLRDLFECIITAARRANRRGSDKIEMEDSKLALSGLGEELSRQISIPDNEKLINIYNNPKYREQIEDLRFLLDKMQALVVLEYRNGKRWHNLHPMIAEFLIKQGVIEIDGKKRH